MQKTENLGPKKKNKKKTGCFFSMQHIIYSFVDFGVKCGLDVS